MITPWKRRGLITGALLAGLLLGTPAAAQDQSALGAINIMVPELWLTAAGADEEISLREASMFDPGDTLRSDETGVALITWFTNGTESALGPNSSLTLNTLGGAEPVETVLNTGHLTTRMGGAPGEAPAGSPLIVSTPAFTVRPLGSEFELWVAESGETTLAVTWGRVDVWVGDSAPFTLDANQYLVSTTGNIQTLSADGITPDLPGICTASATTNLNVRLAPNEDSRRLGGVLSGQVFWVRSATQGNLWLQVYFQTDEQDEEARNFGWIYGPAVQLDPAACGTILRSALNGRLFGGPGIENTVRQHDPVDPAG